MVGVYRSALLSSQALPFHVVIIPARKISNYPPALKQQIERWVLPGRSYFDHTPPQPCKLDRQLLQPFRPIPSVGSSPGSVHPRMTKRPVDTRLLPESVCTSNLVYDHRRRCEDALPPSALWFSLHETIAQKVSRLVTHTLEKPMRRIGFQKAATTPCSFSWTNPS